MYYPLFGHSCEWSPCSCAPGGGGSGWGGGCSRRHRRWTPRAYPHLAYKYKQINIKDFMEQLQQGFIDSTPISGNFDHFWIARKFHPIGGCHIIHMAPAALLQDRAGAGLTSY